MSSIFCRFRVAIEILVCFVPVTLACIYLSQALLFTAMYSPHDLPLSLAVAAASLFGLMTGWEIGGRYILRGYWPNKLKPRVWAGLFSGAVIVLALTIAIIGAGDFNLRSLLIISFCWLPVLAVGDWVYMQRRQSAVG